jgi:glucose-1-phosphate cytidylyltransferase
MKTVILAGGLGTRISEETDTKPKPMVLLNQHPILWHLMSTYALQGYSDFVIAAGYKGEVIHEWVANLETSWKIEIIDTGLNTQTAGRIRKCMDSFPNEPIMATYGDGLANVNIGKLLDFHRRQRRLATVTAVRPPARFGVLESSNGLVTHFGEKRQSDAGWINGGFFVLEPGVSQFIESELEPFETGPLMRLVAESELSAYSHYGFWQPMDTLRERNELTALAKSAVPPWLEINEK